MKQLARVTSALVALTLLAACVTQEQKDKSTISKFKEQVSGQWVNDATGATLFIAEVRARMVTDEALYLEKHQGTGILSRIVNIAIDKKGEIVLIALTFAQEGQWRELRENPELLTGLLPKDVRPAGTCIMKPADDKNSLGFSCGGAAVETYRRM